MSTPRIRKFRLAADGVHVTLEDGSRRRLAFGLLGAGDIAEVGLLPGGRGLVLQLRNGERLEREVEELSPVGPEQES